VTRAAANSLSRCGEPEEVEVLACLQVWTCAGKWHLPNGCRMWLLFCGWKNKDCCKWHIPILFHLQAKRTEISEYYRERIKT
jgi:hypothetical protein